MRCLLLSLILTGCSDDKAVTGDSGTPAPSATAPTPTGTDETDEPTTDPDSADTGSADTDSTDTDPIDHTADTGTTGGPPADADGDGFDETTDCDDTNPWVFPGAVEVCDGVDDDCDKVPDDDCADCQALVPTRVPAIGDAIAAAAEGDVVCIEPGTYFERLDLSGTDVHLLGLAGAAATIIDGGDAGTVVTMRTGETAAAVLEGLTLTNGAAEDGGGLHLDGTSPTVIDVVIQGNAADNEGGGVYARDSWALFRDVEISDNTAVDEGGGAHFVNGEPVLERVQFLRNASTASDGGGLSADFATVTATDLVVEDNEADSGGGIDMLGTELTALGATIRRNCADDGNGGGIRASSSEVWLEDAVVADNVATGFFAAGGGLDAFDGVYDFIRTEFTGNTADRGGGLRIYGDSVVVGAQTTVSGNTADDGAGFVFDDDFGGTCGDVSGLRVFDNHTVGLSLGGGIYVLGCEEGRLHNLVVASNSASSGGGVAILESGAVTLENLVVADNEATTGNGGGLWVRLSSPVLDHLAVVANTADDHGGGVYFEDDAPVATHLALTDNDALSGGAVYVDSGSPAVTHSVLWANVPDEIVGVVQDPSVVSADPQWLDTSAALAVDWDLHLGATSTAIDAGDAGSTDADGTPADPGAYGGAGGATWDLDGDGAPAWYQPGPYDPVAYPGLGLDCDDLDPALGPGSGC